MTAADGLRSPDPAVDRGWPLVRISLAVWAAAGLLGLAMALAYRSDDWWQVAHSATPWIVFGVACGLWRSARLAMWYAGSGYVVAVTAFYFLGSVVLGGYSLNASQLVLWWLIAAAAGTAIGAGASWSAGGGWTPLVSAAFIFGLLLSDLYVRATHYHDALNSAVKLDLLALVAATVYLRKRKAPLGVVVALSIPMTLIGLVLISLPDRIEEIVLVGVIPPVVY